MSPKYNATSKRKKTGPSALKTHRAYSGRRKIHALALRGPDGDLKVESFFGSRDQARKAARQRGLGYMILSAYI